MSDRFALTDRVAVITGAGTGISRASALVLAEHGADIVLAGRRPDPLQATAKEVEALGRRSLIVPTDVTETQQCQHLVDAALADFGRLDILVNNAGGVKPKASPDGPRKSGTTSWTSTSAVCGSCRGAQ